MGKNELEMMEKRPAAALKTCQEVLKDFPEDAHALLKRKQILEILKQNIADSEERS